MNRLSIFASALVLGSLIAATATAQIPDKFTNLKVLPKDIQKAELMDRMKFMSRSLGVRCWFCHKGEEGQPLSTFDFPSDVKKHKETARMMIKMVRDINGKYLKEMGHGEQEGHEAHEHEEAKVTCNTCHRGHEEPEK